MPDATTEVLAIWHQRHAAVLGATDITVEEGALRLSNLLHELIEAYGDAVGQLRSVTEANRNLIEQRDNLAAANRGLRGALDTQLWEEP